MSEKPAKRGRPSTYTQERGARIIALVKRGVSWRQIEKRRGMPQRGTIRAWTRAHPEFGAAVRP